MALMESTQKLKAGDRAPDFNLVGVDGKFHKLDDYSQARAILVVFMCNHCPYVLAKMPALLELHRVYAPKGVAVIGINSNNNPDYPDDDFAHMQAFAKEKGMRFPYLFDDSQNVAKAYGAVCTPDPFLFDGTGALVYHGRIDDAMTPDAQPAKHDLADALDMVLDGR
ncbi:MAG: thioredoxin family protein, partial [Candidatus Micrarchaeota archaeon]|nr:thioredoxin family protein [Candidatus Micrarchaeota archaeon]